MTNEQVYYFKLMLESGLADSFDNALDSLLEQEDPLSDLVLELSTCGGNRNKQVHILNEYILQTSTGRIDRTAVFSLVIDDLRSRYEKEPNKIEQLTCWMYSAAKFSDWWDEDPWNTMLLMNDYYYYWREGILSEELFMESFTSLLYKMIPINPMQKRFLPRPSQHSIIDRIKHCFNR